MTADLPEIEHGTPSGPNAHRARGEMACALCLRAKAVYQKAWRQRDKCAPGLGWPLRSMPVQRRRGMRDA